MEKFKLLTDKPRIDNFQIIDDSDIHKYSVLVYKYNDIDRFFNSKRCGIIPYVSLNNEKYYCLAIDKGSGELTDFAGGRKGPETPLQAAKREFDEENLGVFNEYFCDWKNRIHVQSYDSLVIFLRFELNLNDMRKISEYYVKNIKEDSENKDIIWIREDVLIDLIYSNEITINNITGRRLYVLLKNLLMSVLATKINFFDVYIT